MSPDDLSVDYFVDVHGHDCYRICLPKGGPCSIVSSAHLIDERKMTLALLVSRLVQRLNGQKWLGPN